MYNYFLFGSTYWVLNNVYGNGYLCYCRAYDGWYTSGLLGNSLGIRPVVEMNDGVYIESGSGTVTDPYILSMETTE